MVRGHVTAASLYILRCTRILFFLFLGSFLCSSQMHRIDSTTLLQWCPMQGRLKTLRVAAIYAVASYSIVATFIYLFLSVASSKQLRVSNQSSQPLSPSRSLSISYRHHYYDAFIQCLYRRCLRRRCLRRRCLYIRCHLLLRPILPTIPFFTRLLCEQYLL